MSTPERASCHQIHPAKLGADLAAEVWPLALELKPMVEGEGSRCQVAARAERHGANVISLAPREWRRARFGVSR
jgi:hypothetical protein